MASWEVGKVWCLVIDSWITKSVVSFGKEEGYIGLCSYPNVFILFIIGDRYWICVPNLVMTRQNLIKLLLAPKIF